MDAERRFMRALTDFHKVQLPFIAFQRCMFFHLIFNGSEDHTMFPKVSRALLFIFTWCLIPFLAGEVTQVTAAPINLPLSSNTWWSLKPLLKPPVLNSTGGVVLGKNPVDVFITSRLLREGIDQAPEADPQTLVRRLYYDVTGLPPSPEEVELFVGSEDPVRYERLVDRLLSSPQYGERWARHWLDVVHYGETHGYDKDQPRPHAWPYRDYVIRSFNSDKPYGRFVREQVAGDVLYPGSRDGIEAMGFVAAGPWDLIGHAEVPETKIDGRIARHLDRDDMVANTMQTFNSLTVQCAQCHDHKFDPIKQEEYYRLQAVFAAVDRADKSYDVDPEIAKKRSELESNIKLFQSRIDEIRERVEKQRGGTVKSINQEIETLSRAVKGDGKGYHSAIETSASKPKWFQVDLAKPTSIEKIVLRPAKDDFNGIGEGFGFPRRFKIEVSLDASMEKEVVVLRDETSKDFPNPKLSAVETVVPSLKAQFVRVTATELALRKDDYIFALAEIEVRDAKGSNIAYRREVSAFDTIEAAPTWGKVLVTDGWYPGYDKSQKGELAQLQERKTQLLLSLVSEGERRVWEESETGLGSAKEELKKLPAQGKAYVATVHKGSGAFKGTGGEGGKPRPIHVLNRGNVLQPGKEVAPGTLSCLESLEGDLKIPKEHAEGERRAALARWLSRNDHPLTWRSMANRVWQYHFGRGLVDTPNDFGRMGSIPTHPELLDWLACELRDSGGSLKSLHRLILGSKTYRQSSVFSKGKGTEVDSENKLLWRQNRRKLEAESVRDCALRLAGKLRSEIGGPSFKDFVVDKPEHSPHYEYHLHDPDDPASHRRSVYRFIVRSQQQPFMTVLDCADPSMQVGKRHSGTSPLQALAMLNNSLVLSMSKHFATKLARIHPSVEKQVERGFYEAAGRPPTLSELGALATLAKSYGLENACRVLLNMNAFVFVD